MLHIIFLYFIAFSDYKERPRCARQISIEHIGISDKSVTSLFVATETVIPPPNSAFFDVIVNKEDFDAVKKSVIAIKPSNRMQSSYRSEFGTFQVTLYDSCNKTETRVYSPERAKLLFHQLEKVKIRNSSARLRIKAYINDNIKMF